jgi:hypothetical protein
MGDRTAVSITVRAADRQAVEDLFEHAEYHREGHVPGTVDLTFYEVDGGGYELLAELAKSGIAFRGSHGDGCEYHGMTFAALGGNFAGTPSPQGELMVGLDPDTCEASAADLTAARHWRQIDEQVVAFFTRGGIAAPA